jgi:hypothetical protein
MYVYYMKMYDIVCDMSVAHETEQYHVSLPNHLILII